MEKSIANDRGFQFITMVQTAIITKYVCDPGKRDPRIARAMWSIEHMENAFKIAEHIPQDFTPREAAESFIRWVFNQPLEPDDKVMLQIVLREEDSDAE